MMWRFAMDIAPFPLGTAVLFGKLNFALTVSRFAVVVPEFLHSEQRKKHHKKYNNRRDHPTNHVFPSKQMDKKDDAEVKNCPRACRIKENSFNHNFSVL